MNDKPKVFLFADGSKESQVLEYESLKNPYIQIEKVKVGGLSAADIESYLQNLPKSVLNSNDITKVHLHFTREDFIEHNIAEQKNRLMSKYPNLSIFFAYEFMSRDVAQLRHAGYYPQVDIQTKKEIEAAGEVFEIKDIAPVKKNKKSK